MAEKDHIGTRNSLSHIHGGRIFIPDAFEGNSKIEFSTNENLKANCPKENAAENPIEANKAISFIVISEYDDMLASMFIDPFAQFSTYKFSANFTPISVDFVKDIVPALKFLAQTKDLQSAYERYVAIPHVRSFVEQIPLSLTSVFQKHAKRYLSIYLPNAGFEIVETTRFDTGKPEACVIATRSYAVGDQIHLCRGLITSLTSADEHKLSNELKRDFSVLYSSRRHCACLFLGPARFVNHDCEPNSHFVVKSDEEVHFRMIKAVAVGEELTTYYGSDYFGVGNEACQCATCEMKGTGAFKVRPESQNSILGDIDIETALLLEDEDEERKRRRTRRYVPLIKYSYTVKDFDLPLQKARGFSSLSSSQESSQNGAQKEICATCSQPIESANAECKRCQMHYSIYSCNWPLRKPETKKKEDVNNNSNNNGVSNGSHLIAANSSSIATNHSVNSCIGDGSSHQATATSLSIQSLFLSSLGDPFVPTKSHPGDLVFILNQQRPFDKLPKIGIVIPMLETKRLPQQPDSSSMAVVQLLTRGAKKKLVSTSRLRLFSPFENSFRVIYSKYGAAFCRDEAVCSGLRFLRTGELPLGFELWTPWKYYSYPLARKLLNEVKVFQHHSTHQAKFFPGDIVTTDTSHYGKPYDARIRSVELRKNEVGGEEYYYYIHYLKFNGGYDEWVAESILQGDAEKTKEEKDQLFFVLKRDDSKNLMADMNPYRDERDWLLNHPQFAGLRRRGNKLFLEMMRQKETSLLRLEEKNDFLLNEEVLHATQEDKMHQKKVTYEKNHQGLKDRSVQPTYSSRTLEKRYGNKKRQKLEEDQNQVNKRKPSNDDGNRDDDDDEDDDNDDDDKYLASLQEAESNGTSDSDYEDKRSDSTAAMRKKRYVKRANRAVFSRSNSKDRIDKAINAKNSGKHINKLMPLTLKRKKEKRLRMIRKGFSKSLSEEIDAPAQPETFESVSDSILARRMEFHQRNLELKRQREKLGEKKKAKNEDILNINSSPRHEKHDSKGKIMEAPEQNTSTLLAVKENSVEKSDFAQDLSTALILTELRQQPSSSSSTQNRSEPPMLPKISRKRISSVPSHADPVDDTAGAYKKQKGENSLQKALPSSGKLGDPIGLDDGLTEHGVSDESSVAASPVLASAKKHAVSVVDKALNHDSIVTNDIVNTDKTIYGADLEQTTLKSMAAMKNGDKSVLCDDVYRPRPFSKYMTIVDRLAKEREEFAKLVVEF